MKSLRETLAKPPLRRLLAAQIPADFADWLDYVAIAALLAYSWNADPYIFALLAVSLGLPYIIIGPIAGILVDKAPVKTVLILSNLGRAAVTFALAFAPDWQTLLLLVFLRSSIDAFFTPAKQTMLQAFTDTKIRLSANGLSHAINQAGKIASPALGGALLIYLLPHQVFYANACLSLLATILFLRLPAIVRPQSDTKGMPFWEEIRLGLALFAKNSRLTGALSLTASGFFAVFLYDTLIAPFTQSLSFKASVVGFVLSAVGTGGLAGALGLSMVREREKPFLWAASGATLSGIALSSLWLAETFAVSLTLWAYLLPFLIIGIASSMVVVPVRTIIQTETPPDRIARITAIGEAMNTTALLIAPFIGATIAHAFSLGSTFLAGGVLMLVVGGFSLWLHKS